MYPRILVSALGCGLAAAAFAQHDHDHGDGAGDATAIVRGPSGATRPEGRSGPPAVRWTTQPLIVPGKAESRSAISMRPLGVAAATLEVFASGKDEMRRSAVPVTDGVAAVAPLSAASGNYHWLQARTEGDGGVRVASTVWYFANPGPAPTQMLATPKAELEIVPQPLPREHAQYREGERWDFAVRWRGRPLPAQAVTLETELGSRSTVFTNEDGVATVLFPRDFGAPGTAAGEGHRRPRAGFVLSTARQEQGRSYFSAFNYSYASEAARSRSPLWGAAFAVLGMSLAAPLLRRREASHD